MKVIALGDVYSKYIMDDLPEQGVVIGATKEELRTLPPTILNCEVEVIEKNTPRNDKAMREALEEMATELEDLASRDGIRAPAYSSIFSIFAEKCRKALAAPPRNCDIGTPDEQSARFDAHCQKHMGCLTCPLREKDGGVPKHCEFAWGAMPRKEGGVS